MLWVRLFLLVVSNFGPAVPQRRGAFYAPRRAGSQATPV